MLFDIIESTGLLLIIYAVLTPIIIGFLQTKSPLHILFPIGLNGISFGIITRIENPYSGMNGIGFGIAMAMWFLFILFIISAIHSMGLIIYILKKKDLRGREKTKNMVSLFVLIPNIVMLCLGIVDVLI